MRSCAPSNTETLEGSRKATEDSIRIDSHRTDSSHKLDLHEHWDHLGQEAKRVSGVA